jgi:sucrose-phosphate synthase
VRCACLNSGTFPDFDDALVWDTTFSLDVFQQIFELVDKYNLYGKVAYPKQHRRDQIPAIYRWAASKRGLFVNPALTEPFGLTLLEAASSGLPIVSTDDGGPRDILSRCQNGLLLQVFHLE